MTRQCLVWKGEIIRYTTHKGADQTQAALITRHLDSIHLVGRQWLTRAGKSCTSHLVG